MKMNHGKKTSDESKLSAKSTAEEKASIRCQKYKNGLCDNCLSCMAIRSVVLAESPECKKSEDDEAREELEKKQAEKLRETVALLKSKVPYYSRLLKDIEVDDIQSIRDTEKLPFTTKEDLRCNYPFGLFAVPKEKLARIHASSGTTGKPTVVGYTSGDIDRWAEMIAQELEAIGVTKEDTVQVAYGYGLFTGGLGLHYGAEKLGATVVPISTGNTAKQLQLMQDFGTTVLACTPSYALHLAEAGKDRGIDFHKLPIRIGILGAEPWTEEMRQEIEKAYGIKAYDIYGLSEIIGPGVGCECSQRQGLHINEEHYIAEIIDPETGAALDYGQTGELVLTSIAKEAMPLLRYRTKDITTLYRERCGCGSLNVRMDRVTGRSDDMLIIKGVNVFPSQIESVIMSMPKLLPHYNIVLSKKGKLDELLVQVETELSCNDGAIAADNLKRNIMDITGIAAEIELLPPKTLPRSQGKISRVTDLRYKTV